MSLARSLALVLAPLALAGCSDLLAGGAAPTTYDLTARADVSGLRGGAGRLAVREPRAIQLFDSDKIVYRPDAATVTYLADAQWPDRLPRLIEARLIAAFEAAGERTVSRAGDALAVQYELMTEVRDFSVASSPEGATAHVGVYAKIVSDTSGRAETGRLFEARVPAASEQAVDGVAALDAALAQVMREIVRWTLNRA